MLELLLLIGFLCLIIWGLMKSYLLGILLCIGVIAYFYFFRYTKICMLMASLRYGKGDVNGSMRWFRRAEKKGMTPEQRITYAYYLMREGRVERAEELLDGVLAFKQKPGVKYVAKSNHAVLLLKTGRVQEAKEELEEIFPEYKSTNIYGSLGYIYIIGDSLEKAKTFNEEAYEFNSDDPVILDNMVQLSMKLEDWDAAYSYACRLMEKQPAFIEAYYNAASVEKKLGKTEDAKAHLEHALTIRSTFMSAVNHEDVKALMESL